MDMKTILVKNKNIQHNPIIAWWSGGIASSVTCYLCCQFFGRENTRIMFIDTHNEDDDTYRFKSDCENLYEKEIETICSDKYSSIQEVWYDNLSLNVATGAVCSYYLKRAVRENFEKNNNFLYQAFGFDIKEVNRAIGLKSNNPKSRPIFPIISELMTKEDCVKYLEKCNNLFHKISLPRAYYLGYRNNNCFKTGCVQGGIGYWKKIQSEFPEKFIKMAKIEHELTEIKGMPVTILKNSKGLIFLKKNSKYPKISELSEVKGREVLPIVECNGFCGMEDIDMNKTLKELNFKN